MAHAKETFFLRCIMLHCQILLLTLKMKNEFTKNAIWYFILIILKAESGQFRENNNRSVCQHIFTICKEVSIIPYMLSLSNSRQKTKTPLHEISFMNPTWFINCSLNTSKYFMRKEVKFSWFNSNEIFQWIFYIFLFEKL